jgi:hypothetical protein
MEHTTHLIEEQTITIPVSTYHALMQSHIRLNILVEKRMDEIKDLSYVSVQTDDIIMGISDEVMNRVREVKKERDNE